MNKIVLSGNLVNDVKSEKTTNGKLVLKNKIAVKDNNNTNFEDTYFINLKAYGKDKVMLFADLKKGDLVKLRGKLVVKSFQNSEKQWVNITEVVVFEIEKINYKKKDKAISFDPQGFQAIDDDDIPF